jgi:PAS domain S-box-containing protein
MITADTQSNRVGQDNAPTVLVVDDDPINLRVTFDILEKVGISVKVAHSGERALQQLDHITVDLILLDIMMPGMSGIETCKRLKKRPDTRDIPIVFMTALTDAKSITDAFDAGASDYITKPFFQQEIVARVKTQLRIQQLQNNLQSRNAELRQNVTGLKAAQHAIQQAHDQLEQRVQKRTAELVEVNERLERKIIEHQWTERALRESEHRFRHVISSISDHIYVMRITELGERYLVYISPKIEAVSGYSQSTFLNNTNFWHSSVVHPDDRHIVKHQWTALAEQQSIEVEYRIIRADGRVMWVRDSASVAQEAQRSITIYGVISDIDSRIQVQERLQAIYKTSRELTLLNNETAILEDVFRIINDAVDFDRASYGLLNKTQDQLSFWALSPDGWQPGISLPVDSEQGVGPVVVRTGRARLINDIGPENHYVSCHADWMARSELCVPMIIKEQVIGVLNLESERPDGFTPDDQLLFQTIADQTAAALQSARLYVEVENRVAQISALALAGRAMSSTLDLETVLTQTMDVARQLLAAEGVAVLLYNPQQDNLFFAAAASPGSERMIGKPVPLEGSIAGWSFVHNEAILVTDAATDPRFYSGIDRTTGLVTQSLLAVPLHHRGAKIGILEAANKASGSFSEDDLKKIETLAYSASTAIANARLFEQVQRGREQLRHLAQEVVNAQEDERQRLSYELHDDVGQTLTALKLSLEMLQGDLPENYEILDRRIEKSIELTIALTRRLRTLARNLRPPALDVTGLNGALEDHCLEFAEQVGIEIVYQGQEVIEASEQAKIFLYRSVQEALNNVAKHARATRVAVTLETLPKLIQLSVVDNGVGFEVDAVMDQPRNKGIGLLGLQERLESLGGNMEISSQTDQGTTLTISLPLEG